MKLNSEIIGFFAYVLIHGHFLSRSGQTIGKKLCGVRIVNRRGNVPDLFKLIARNMFPSRLFPRSRSSALWFR